MEPGPSACASETLEAGPERSEGKYMNWTVAGFVLVVAAIFYFLQRKGQISREEARAHLKNGALLIDVRSPSEFNSRHLPGAINLPLDKIETLLPQRVGNKPQVLLLHCQSGMRSGAAKRKLQGMGHSNVFNLGSYARAAQAVGDN